MQNTGTCDPGLGWICQVQLGFGLFGLSPGSWQTSLALGSMSRYSAQIIICMIYHIKQLYVTLLQHNKAPCNCIAWCFGIRECMHSEYRRNAKENKSKKSWMNWFPVPGKTNISTRYGFDAWNSIDKAAASVLIAAETDRLAGTCTNLKRAHESFKKVNPFHLLFLHANIKCKKR